MRRHRRRRTGLMAKFTSDGGLTLTSMMDILTTLLFFVLKSYISGAEVTSPPPGVTLPRSSVDSGMRTSVVIAHHLGTIRGSDVIFAIKDAELVESGTHETLVARQGVYASLYQIQTAADGEALSGRTTPDAPRRSA